MKNRLTNRLTLSAVALGGALLLTDGVLAMNGPDQAAEQNNDTSSQLKVDETAINRTAPLDDSFAPIVQKATPSVVQISVTSSAPARMLSGSAAAAAGLQSGDIILDFSGKPVQDASQLKLRVAETAPGVTVPVVVLRNGENKTISVTFVEPRSPKYRRMICA